MLRTRPRAGAQVFLAGLLLAMLLGAWEGEGIARRGRQKVTVTDPHMLMLIAENRRKT